MVGEIRPHVRPLNGENLRPGDIYFIPREKSQALEPMVVTAVGEDSFSYRDISTYAFSPQGEHVREHKEPYGDLQIQTTPFMVGFAVGVRESGLEVMLHESQLEWLGKLEEHRELLMGLPHGWQFVKDGVLIPGRSFDKNR